MELKNIQGYLSTRPRLCFFLFFLIPYWLYAIIVYRDYGIALDEQMAYRFGAELKLYLVNGQGTPELFAWHNFIYPAFVALFSQGILEKCHLINLLFATLIYALCFEVLWVRCRSILWALGGALALFLTPGFSGAVPNNAADAPFAVFYFVSLCSIYLVRARLKDHWSCVFIFGIIFGIAACFRIVGFSLFPILFLYDFYQNAIAPAPPDGSRKRWRKWFGDEISILFLIVVVSQLCMAYFWPSLRHDYFNHFLEIIRLQAKFEALTLYMFFMGGMVSSFEYPWYYVPLWLLVTLPLFTITFFIGSFWGFWKKFSFKAQSEPYVVFLTAFILNMTLYLVIRPHIFDGLRLFIYLMPVLTMIAYLTIVDFFKNCHSLILKKIAIIFLALNFLTVSAQMIMLHPYEYIYFNELVGGTRGASKNFELDYRFTALKEAIEWLADNEVKDAHRIYTVGFIGVQEIAEYYFSKTGHMAACDDAQSYGGFVDYTFQTTRGGKITLTPELKSQLIHVVQREGAPLIYIFKKPHAYLQIN